MRHRRWAAIVPALALAGGCADPDRLTAVPECEVGSVLTAVAQSVPTASLLPCVAEELPRGWAFGELEVERGRTRFWLGPDETGTRAVRITLDETCDINRATEVEVADPAITRWLRLDLVAGRVTGAWLHTFAGGCVSWDFTFSQDVYDVDQFNVELDDAVDFFPRAEIAEDVRDDYGVELDP